MSQVELPVSITVPSSGDLSASLYRFVSLNGSGQAVVTGAGADAIGILTNKPTALGQAAEVQILGRAKLVAGGTIASQARVASTASGAGLTVATGNFALATCLVGGVINDLIEVLLSAHPQLP